MEIFKDNINKIKNDLVKGSFELNKLHTTGKILNLYESTELLKDYLDTEAFYNNSEFLKFALIKKYELQKKNFSNFKNSYFELYELFLGIKTILENKILVNDNVKNKSNVVLDNRSMFSLLREYYMTCQPLYKYSLFTGIDKNLCISSKTGSYFDKNISSPLLNNNYIFVENRENVATTADIVFCLEQLANKTNLESCGSKDLYSYLYFDNFKYVHPLIERKKYLSWLIEKDPMYYEDINKIFIEDYGHLFEGINELSDIMKKDKSTILATKDMDTINYIYGQVLSDIYLYLNEAQRVEFSNLIMKRKNKLFKKDILFLLEELTEFRSYGFSKIVEEQYKKYIKKS